MNDQDQPHPHRHPGVTWSAIAAELAREIAARHETYPREIAKGNITQSQAETQIYTMQAIAADLRRFAAARDQGVNPLTLDAGHRFTWAQRRDAITRELALRRRHYPQWIAKGRLLSTTARQQVNALEAMLLFYENGLDWQASNGIAPAFPEPDPTREQAAARAEWLTLAAEIHARLFPVHQQEIAL